MHIAAGLHFGKSSNPQYHQAVHPAGPLPLPALPHRTAWLLIGLQVPSAQVQQLSPHLHMSLALLRILLKCLMHTLHTQCFGYSTYCLSPSRPEDFGPCPSECAEGARDLVCCASWQAFALVGCLVTGTLARRRRLEVEGLNNRLRQINTELMKRGTVEVSRKEEESLHLLQPTQGSARSPMGGPANIHRPDRCHRSIGVKHFKRCKAYMRPCMAAAAQAVHNWRAGTSFLERKQPAISLQQVAYFLMTPRCNRHGRAKDWTTQVAAFACAH